MVPSSLVMPLHILTYVFLVACVLFICHPPSALSYHHRLTNASFLAALMNTRGFLSYDQSEKRMWISRNVICLEHVPFFSLRLDSHPVAVSCLPQFPESTSPSTITKVCVRCNTIPPVVPPSPDHLPVPPTASSVTNDSSDSIIPLWRSSRPSVAPHRFGFPAHFTSLDSALIPTTYSQALKIAYWQDAMNEDLLALEANKTWELVPAPEGASVIGSK